MNKRLLLKVMIPIFILIVALSFFYNYNVSRKKDLDTAVLYLDGNKYLKTFDCNMGKIKCAMNVELLGSFKKISLYNIVLTCKTKDNKEFEISVRIPDYPDINSINKFHFDEKWKDLSLGDEVRVVTNIYRDKASGKLRAIDKTLSIKGLEDFDSIITFESGNKLEDDQLYLKYLDKNEIHDFNDFYEDFSNVMQDNWIRGQAVFSDSKVRVKAKIDNIFMIDSKVLLKYDILNDIAKVSNENNEKFEKFWLLYSKKFLSLSNKQIYIYEGLANESHTENYYRAKNEYESKLKTKEEEEIVFTFSKDEIDDRTQILFYKADADLEILNNPVLTIKEEMTNNDGKLVLHPYNEENTVQNKKEVLDRIKGKYQIIEFGKDSNKWIVLQSNDDISMLLSLYDVKDINVEYDNKNNEENGFENSNICKYLNEEYIKNFDIDDLNLLKIDEYGNKVSILSSKEYHKYFPNYKDGALPKPFFIKTSMLLGGIKHLLSVHEDGMIYIFEDVNTVKQHITKYAGVRPLISIDTKKFNEKYNNILIKNDTFTLNIGDKFRYGSYEQDNILSNGKEDLYWYMLSDFGDKVLLFCENVIDKYIPEDDVIYRSWEESNMRKFANGKFMDSAFSDDERNHIQIATLKNTALVVDYRQSGNYIRSKYQGANDTNDKVFLISIEDADLYDYKKEEFIMGKPTEYALANGVKKQSKKHGEAWYVVRDFNVDSTIKKKDKNIFEYTNVCMTSATLKSIKSTLDKGYGFRPAIIVDKNYLLSKNN